MFSLLFFLKEINSLKSTVSTQKLNHEEILQQEKLRIKNEEEKIQHELEDRLRSLTTTKEELEVNYLINTRNLIVGFFNSLDIINN